MAGHKKRRKKKAMKKMKWLSSKYLSTISCNDLKIKPNTLIGMLSIMMSEFLKFGWEGYFGKLLMEFVIVPMKKVQ